MLLNAYITIDGSCAEALEYYKKVFGGEITRINYYKESPENIPDNFKDKIMHSELKFETSYLMLADKHPDCTVDIGNNISISVILDRKEDLNNSFNLLAKEGKVSMQLQKMHWGSIFGIVIDKYNITWMLSCVIK